MKKKLGILVLSTALMTACGTHGNTQKTPNDNLEESNVGTDDSKALRPQPSPTSFPTVTPTPKNDTTAEPNPLDNVTYSSHSVLREFKSTNGKIDRASLFLVLPSQGSISINQVTGPSFIKQVKVGILDADKMKTFFENSQLKMPESEKNEILKKYRGAVFLYFENYAGLLCDQNSHQIKASSTLLGKSVSLSFTFEAVASQSGNCVVYSSTFLASSFN